MSPKRSPITIVRHKRKKTKKASRKSLFWIVTVVLASLSVGAYYFFNQQTKILTPAKLRAIVPEGFPTIGIDISHHQGEMDWDQLFNQSGYDSLIHFVYCKATEGNTLVDSQWERNRKKLNEIGIPNGAYHFFISTDPPRPQVAHFLSHWKKRDIDLPPVLDVETEGISDQDLIDKMRIWLNEVEFRTGMRPVIYTSLHFYETKFQHVFTNYKFWIAAYNRKPDCANDPRIIHWQFTDRGRIPGTREKVDLNVSKIVY